MGEGFQPGERGPATLTRLAPLGTLSQRAKVWKNHQALSFRELVTFSIGRHFAYVPQVKSLSS